MRYGHFDEGSREYVITRPDTPTPWINYLGNGGYSAIISNCAGGMSFHRDPSLRRVTRYRFNGVPMDRPGKYVYLRDLDSGEYWSPSWQPVMKPLDRYECRHGMGYTKIAGRRCAIDAETTYFVPLEKDYEVWLVRLQNASQAPRRLKVFAYVEFSWHEALRDTLCDWPRKLFDARFTDGHIIFDPLKEGEPLYAYFGASAAIDSYDCSRDVFLGAYRTESNPQALEAGACSNSSVVSDNACGGLCCAVPLAPGEGKTILFVLGVAESREATASRCRAALSIPAAEEDLDAVRRSWETFTSRFKVSVPDADVELMLNTWNQYQCKTTFDWSRFVSFYERGVDRGFGFRDSMQDVLGVMHAVPGKARARIIELLAIQKKRGDAMSILYPATGAAVGGGRSDDHLWSVLAVCAYIKETGDTGILEAPVPFHDGGEGSVLEHLVNGINFTMAHRGRHGLPLFLGGDWNDTIVSITKKPGAESAFVFFQLGHAVRELIGLFQHVGLTGQLAWAQGVYDDCRSKVDTVWDGQWFLRAFTGDGAKYGTGEDGLNRIFLNPQSWAVLSGLCSRERALAALDSVKEYLDTDIGVMANYPATSRFDPEQKLYFWNPAGWAENGGIFNHTNTWLIIAEALMGRAEHAWEYYRKVLPPKRNDAADECKVEPYVYCQSMNSPQHVSPRVANNSWLTGTASWMFYAATQYILGIRPDYDGLLIDPCIPAAWDHVRVEREFRGTRFIIDIRNRSGAPGRVQRLEIDGDVIEGNMVDSARIGNAREMHVAAEV